MLTLEWVNETRVKGHIIMNLNAKEWEVGKGSSLLCTMYLLLNLKCPKTIKQYGLGQTFLL